MLYEIAGKNVDLSGEVTFEEILKDIIEADQVSQRKIEMVQGVNYYASHNDILNRDFREFYVDGVKYIDYNKSNEQIVNNLHKKLVDQKQGYIIGKPFSIGILERDEANESDKELIQKVNDLLGDRFQETVSDWIKNASNKGTEEIQPFINAEGEFDYCLIPSEQVIYITDTTYQKNIEQAIRYYAMEFIEDGEVNVRKRVEVWDKEKVTRYQEVDDGYGNLVYQFILPGTYGVMLNPEYHWYTYNTNFTDKSQLASFNDVAKETAEGHGWGKVPIICLKNNTEKRSDLAPIKKYIDALDVVSSGFMNDLRDLQLAIWVLRGYEGESLADFMLNLQKYKSLLLDNTDSSSAEPKTMDIPKEARSAMMEWLETKIYEIGQGVDEQKISGGSITNVVIKAMYSGLDIKSNQLIVKLRAALSEFMYFVVEYINDRDGTDYNYKDIKFTFNTSMLFNTKEIIEGLVMLTGIISDRTLLANIPYVDDVEEELMRIEEEKAKEVDSLETDFNPVPTPIENEEE